jgi:uncharacterized protein (TIGR00251 family)
MLTKTRSGVILSVRVVPRARKTEIGGVRGEALLVRVAAPPVDGAANAVLVDLLADALGVPRSAIEILGGDRGRHKRIAIAGVSPELVRTRLL